MMRILIAGCGYVGVRLAQTLHRQGHEIFGLRRYPPASVPFLTWIPGDLTAPAPSWPVPFDRVVLAAGLRRDTEERYEQLLVEGYGRLLASLQEQAHPVQRVLMVSTTGVFQEEDGGGVDESSPVNADRVPSRYYLAAEQLARNAHATAVVARMSGIYGPERFRLIREVREDRARCFPPPTHYLNHLHADDAAGALAHLLTIPDPRPLYIVSDEEPADRNDVLTWIAHRLGVPPPPPIETGLPRPSRRSGNKRCSSNLLRSSGYRFTYPTYREGYQDLLTD